jgi:membrane protein
VQKLRALLAWFQRTPVGRAWGRYNEARGTLLAGGVAYFAFFSIFPAIALAFTVFGLVLRGYPELLDQIHAFLDRTLPGFVKPTPDSTKGIIPISVPSGQTLTTTGIVGGVVLLWSGLGWLGALRQGIREVFGVPGSPGNLVTAKLRDLVVLIGLGIGIVASAGITILATSAARWTANLIGLGGQGWIFTAIGLLVGFVLDTALILVILRVLSGVDVPWPGLRNGALFGGAGLTVLKLFGRTLIGAATRNPLFASIALVVGLLLWLQLMSRLVLISAAWAANDLQVATAAAVPVAAPVEPSATDLEGSPGVPAAVLAPSRRAADRSTLAAGALLGALGVLGLGAALRRTRALLRRSPPSQGRG